MSAESSEDSIHTSAADDEYPVTIFEAVYVGVYGYGEGAVTAEAKDSFIYSFRIGEEEKQFTMYNGTKTEGSYDYPIQNTLRIGERYRITVEKGTVTEAVPLDEAETPTAVFPASAVPGQRTLRNFLATALLPMGSTLYVYGGGWNWQDNGASHACRGIGLSPSWSAFFEAHDGHYTYRGENAANGVDYYPNGGWNEYYYAGLDCSGFVGWTVYNTLHTEDGGEGYVMPSTQMAGTLAQKGFGVFSKDRDGLRPGDIVSIQGHVWISLGTCSDGSAVIAHSTPSVSREGQPGGGVQLTALGVDESCEAYALVERYMRTYFPAWYARYGATLRSYDGYTDFSAASAGRFRWTVKEGSCLSDPEGVGNMTADNVLSLLFGEKL